MRLSEKDIEVIAEQLPDNSEFQEGKLPPYYSGGPSRRLAAAATYAQRVFLTSEQFRFQRLPFEDFSAGFIARHRKLELTSKMPESGAFTFGIMVRARQLDPENPQRLLGRISYQGVELPIILSSGAEERHTPSVNPVVPGQGSTTCWVKPAPGNTLRWSQGALTARHIVESLNTGDPVHFGGGHLANQYFVGYLADKGACPIDAAVVELAPSELPGSLSQLFIAGPHKLLLPPGINVNVQGAASGAWTAKILRHFALPDFWGAMIGQRVFLDVPGMAGDSGALVQASNTGEGLGIYMGTIPDGLGGHEAVCQDLYQASVYLDFEAYL
ncbi:hypothetical protein [Hyphomonas sp.]|uniref:hypothetical protein n=1 Tax=Hyphomonas sp. TaxID=87 RepID=UPI0025C38680|nr:hypothetical protein [Hyphomonas sp.]